VGSGGIPSTELRTGNAWGCLIISWPYVRAYKSRDPIALMQKIVMDEYAGQIKARKEPIHSPNGTKATETQENKGVKPYDEELEGLE